MLERPGSPSAVRIGRASAALWVLVLACSAETPTALVVVVDTDFAIPAELDNVQIRVTGPSGVSETLRARLDGTDSVELPLTLTLVPKGDQLGPVRVLATGLRGTSTVATREAETSFMKGSARMLRLLLLRSCLDAECDVDESCDTNGCTEVELNPEDLPEWIGPPGRVGTGEPTDGSMPDGGVDSGDAGGCSVGQLDCDGDGECETEGATAENCGACGVTCRDSTPFCSLEGDLATCSATCTETMCGEECVDVSSSAAHCGGCNEACPSAPANATSVCVASECVLRCAPGFDDCDGELSTGCEESLETDSSCGACGFQCGSLPRVDMAACAGGACSITTCDAGFANCDGMVMNGCERSLGLLFSDEDGDGFGAAAGSMPATSCTVPAGFVDNADDCDDAMASVSPGASEICNGEDENCDGNPDDGFLCASGSTGSCTSPCEQSLESAMCAVDCMSRGTCDTDCDCAEFGSDSFGYRGCSRMGLPCAEPPEGAAALMLDDDDLEMVPIGFRFAFYGMSYENVWIQSNGGVSFGPGDRMSAGTRCLPSSGRPANVISFWHEDLDPSEGASSITYATVGSAPSRQFVLRVVTEEFGAGDGTIEVRLVLHETSNDISICYVDTELNGSSDHAENAAIGIQSGGTGISYSCREPSVQNATMLHYFAPAQ